MRSKFNKGQVESVALKVIELIDRQMRSIDKEATSNERMAFGKQVAQVVLQFVLHDMAATQRILKEQQ